MISETAGTESWVVATDREFRVPPNSEVAIVGWTNERSTVLGTGLWQPEPAGDLAGALRFPRAIVKMTNQGVLTTVRNESATVITIPEGQPIGRVTAIDGIVDPMVAIVNPQGCFIHDGAVKPAVGKHGFACFP